MNVYDEAFARGWATPDFRLMARSLVAALGSFSYIPEKVCSVCDASYFGAACPDPMGSHTEASHGR